MRNAVLVGGALASVSAAQTLRDEGFQGRITIVGAEPHEPYDRPPLSKQCLSTPIPTAQLRLRDPAWYVDQQVSLRLGEPATGLDLLTRQIHLESGDTIEYDGAVIATGAHPRRMPGAETAAGPLVLRTAEDARALHEMLATSKTLVVVGAGFIGLEVAATAVGLGLHVTLIELAPVPLAHVMGDRLGEWFVKLHRSHGVDVRCGVKAMTVTGGPGAYQVKLSDGSSVQADAVVTAVGVRPTTQWLTGSGIALGDGVLCDQFCRTSAAGVVAAGDVARWYSPLFDEQLRVEHRTNAVEQGRAAALTLLGRMDQPYDVTPYFWSDQYDAKVRFVGHTFAATDLHVQVRSERSFVALFGRDGLIRAALCVNSPSAVARHAHQIKDRIGWADAVDSIRSSEG